MLENADEDVPELKGEEATDIQMKVENALPFGKCLHFFLSLL